MSHATTTTLPDLPAILVEDGVRRGLAEDLGRAGDITSMSTIPKGRTARATFAAREDGRLCGIAFADWAFRLTDAGLRFEALAEDGAAVSAGQPIARVSGDARAILSAERVALNYLCHLSGVATATARFADLVAHTRARICCTRKTTPGLRAFEKYAVRCGGGANHRFGLDDAVLIKDNHIAVCGGIAEAIEVARAHVGHLVAIEVEVDTLDQLDAALGTGIDAILLDNFAPDDLRRAVETTRGRARLEASGGISLETVRAVAETGVDYISSSKITISAPTIDIGLDIGVSDGPGVTDGLGASEGGR